MYVVYHNSLKEKYLFIYNVLSKYKIIINIIIIIIVIIIITAECHLIVFYVHILVSIVCAVDSEKKRIYTSYALLIDIALI